MALPQLNPRIAAGHCRWPASLSNARHSRIIMRAQTTRTAPVPLTGKSQYQQHQHDAPSEVQSTTGAQAAAYSTNRPSPAAAGVALMATAAAAAGPTYHLLSAASLPSLPELGGAVAAAGGAAAAGLGLTKLVMGDLFHVQLHKGRLYLQAGVPSSGPPLPPGSVITQPTGDARGNGAFAAAPIAAGSHIADYSGELLDRAAFYQRYPDGVGDYAMAVDGDYVIDAAGVVADTSVFHPVHMNHSRVRPNVRRYYHRPTGRMAFFASRDVHIGEELLYNYGTAYWSGREHLELP